MIEHNAPEPFAHYVGPDMHRAEVAYLRTLNAELARKLSEAREAGERDRRDAERYRVLRLYTLHSATWDEKRYPNYPGLLGWSGTRAGKPYSETVIDAMMDELINSEWTRSHCPAIDHAIAAAKKEG